jgi:prepilin-type N-terminal cleavage/methylation domain-containing protein
MHEKTKKQLSGFTLIELMISMAILSIMTTVTIVSMGGAKTKQEVEGAARQVAAALREAQNYALTGKNIGASGDVPCQFRLEADGTSTFTIQQKKFDSGVCTADSGSPMSYSLSNGVTVSTNNASFDVPRGEVFNDALGELNGDEKVDFSISKDGSTAHVCLYPFGRIEERSIGGSC